MTEKIINASAVFSPSVKESILSNRAQRDAAIERYNQQTQDVVDRAIAYLNDNPGAVLTGVDIADATGIPKSTLEKKMISAYYSHRVGTTRVSITRHFAQVDENGQLIPGGRTHDQEVRMRGYKKWEGRW